MQQQRHHGGGHAAEARRRELGDHLGLGLEDDAEDEPVDFFFDFSIFVAQNAPLNSQKHD